MSPHEKTPEQLAEEVRNLGPWHQGIQITPDFNTSDPYESTGEMNRRQNQNISLLTTLYDGYMDMVRPLYPQGLAGKKFLDCACNAGVYCFAARSLGADYSFGFDIREHWINQARWVQQHRTVTPTDNVEFGVCDVYDLPQRGLPMFDLTMFKGIFYHLPDPITALKNASDLTREVLIFNTQATWGKPDGYLKPGSEDIRSLMSGAYGLNWRPTGPRTMIPVFSWLGFKEARLIFYRQNPTHPELGRLEIVASKVEGLLDGLADYPNLYEMSAN